MHIYNVYIYIYIHKYIYIFPYICIYIYRNIYIVYITHSKKNTLHTCYTRYTCTGEPPTAKRRPANKHLQAHQSTHHLALLVTQRQPHHGLSLTSAGRWFPQVAQDKVALELNLAAQSPKLKPLNDMTDFLVFQTDSSTPSGGS